jgi:hypothetical protein
MILAKFGYRPDVKVEKFKNLFVFWLHASTRSKYVQNAMGKTQTTNLVAY